MNFLFFKNYKHRNIQRVEFKYARKYINESILKFNNKFVQKNNNIWINDSADCQI
jgi:hypothetical protein